LLFGFVVNAGVVVVVVFIVVVVDSVVYCGVVDSV